MRVTYERQMVAPFFHQRLGLEPSENFRGVLYFPDGAGDPAVTMDDVAVAVSYDAFIGRTCCMHVVVQRPDLLNRRMVREAFAFPFVTANCNAVLALVDSTNTAALDFDTRLGFAEIARIPEGGSEGDLVILKMQRSACRWLH